MASTIDSKPSELVLDLIVMKGMRLHSKQSFGTPEKIKKVVKLRFENSKNLYYQRYIGGIQGPSYPLCKSWLIWLKHALQSPSHDTHVIVISGSSKLRFEEVEGGMGDMCLAIDEYGQDMKIIGYIEKEQETGVSLEEAMKNAAHYYGKTVEYVREVVDEEAAYASV